MDLKRGIDIAVTAVTQDIEKRAKKVGLSATGHRRMGSEERRGIKAVEVAAQILDHLARAQKSVPLRELAAAGRMSPGKPDRYLASFVASGLARQDDLGLQP